jgi:hypothetical protein
VLAEGKLPEVRIADRTLDGTARIRKPPPRGQGRGTGGAAAGVPQLVITAASPGHGPACE